MKLNRRLAEECLESNNESRKNSAMVMLWEKHCQFPKEQKWPPTIDEIEKELDSQENYDDNSWL